MVGQCGMRTSPERKVLGIPTQDFIDFLIHAKKKGYAGEKEYNIDKITGEKVLSISGYFVSVNSKGYTFSYEDRYSGYFKAPGREIVSLTKIEEIGQPQNIHIPIWTMCYGFHPEDGMQDRFKSDQKMAHEVFTFLKQALSNPDKDRPLRGPKEFENGIWTYNFYPNGYIDGFEGPESISCIDRKRKICGTLFKQHVSGGLIQHKDLEVKLV